MLLTAPAPPPAVIFDTDMGNDVDDALALAVLHSLADRGACTILAVTLTRDDPWSARYCDAVNTFWGRGALPIGVTHNRITGNPSPFLHIAEKFPQKLDPAKASEAVALIRKLLVAQPDGSVTLVQVGFFSNFAALGITRLDLDTLLSTCDAITLHAPVTDYWPEFGQNGRDSARVFGTLDHSIGLLITAALLVYLTYALLRPEKF